MKIKLSNIFFLAAGAYLVYGLFKKAQEQSSLAGLSGMGDMGMMRWLGPKMPQRSRHQSRRSYKESLTKEQRAWYGRRLSK